MPKRKGKDAQAPTLDNVIMSVNMPNSPRGASYQTSDSVYRFPNLWDDDDGFAAKESAYAQKKRDSVIESKRISSSNNSADAYR